jgi:hypothetical protein
LWRTGGVTSDITEKGLAFQVRYNQGVVQGVVALGEFKIREMDGVVE